MLRDFNREQISDMYSKLSCSWPSSSICRWSFCFFNMSSISKSFPVDFRSPTRIGDLIPTIGFFSGAVPLRYPFSSSPSLSQAPLLLPICALHFCYLFTTVRFPELILLIFFPLCHFLSSLLPCFFYPFICCMIQYADFWFVTLIV